MDFYESIIKYYDKIFPLKKPQVTFVSESFTEPEKASLLDVGCGTGSLAIELSRSFNSVVAADLDKAMIDKAKKKNPGSVEFMELDMLSIAERFGQEAFDGLICVGNTLVHLPGPEPIQDFLNQAEEVLKPTGCLLIQVINYDRIIDEQVKGLPTIETDELIFRRIYNYGDDPGCIDFETRLTSKATGDELVNHVDLYPLRRAELDALLRQAGFSAIKYYGNFKRERLDQDSQPLIVECRR
jgi:SAM-dependent methyltransferase